MNWRRLTMAERARSLRFCGAVAVWLSTLGAAAQSTAPGLPENVASRPVNIWSEGTRLSGDLFYPKDAKEGENYPAILLTHGWGGVRAHLNRAYAPYFAAAGFVVLTFDYRGWGDSDSKLVIQGEMPKPDAEGMVTVKARAIRQLVDPFDQVQDIRHALDWLEGEPMVDATRLGIWGTSYSGGHVIYVAAIDDRVKCVVGQVGAMDSRDAVENFYREQGGVAYAHRIGIARVRGEKDPIPQGEDVFPGLTGTPFLAKMHEYRPVELAHRIEVPVLIIDAEKEELFDHKRHGGRVAEILKEGGKAPVKYVEVPGITHYGIYREKLVEGRQLALDWFKAHLQPAD